MRELNKKIKIKILEDAIKMAKNYKKHNHKHDLGLCYLLEKIYKQNKISDIYTYDIIKYEMTNPLRFKELTNEIRKALIKSNPNNCIVYYKNWWGGRIRLLQRVLKQIKR